MTKSKSLFLVSIQFCCLGYLLVTGPVIPAGLFSLILYISGIALGIWAILKIKEGSKLQITPEVKEGSKLIIYGPYKYIRHPMYAGILMVGIGLLLNSFSPLKIVILTILFVDLLVKINYEEELLKQHFDGYLDYQRSTYKLIPYIY